MEKTSQVNNIISEEPDTPIPFGMKQSWLVIKEKDQKVVIEKLHGTDIKVCNWKSAFTHMKDPHQIFITPCYNGYILVLNYPAPLENKDILQSLADEFEEVQFFASHRIVDLSCWVKYKNHKLIRSFYYVGEQGKIFWNEGSLTKEEQEIGLTTASFDFDTYYENTVYPDEYVVNDIAAKWSVDPFMDAYQDTKSTGFLCKVS